MKKTFFIMLFVAWIASISSCKSHTDSPGIQDQKNTPTTQEPKNISDMPKPVFFAGELEVRKFDFFAKVPNASSCFKVTFEGPKASRELFYNNAFVFAVREDNTGWICVNGEIKTVNFQTEWRYMDSKNQKHSIKTFEKDALRVSIDTYATKQYEDSTDISGVLSVHMEAQKKDYKVIGYSEGDGCP